MSARGEGEGVGWGTGGWGWKGAARSRRPPSTITPASAHSFTPLFSTCSLLGWVEREKRRYSRLEDESFDVEEYPEGHYYENESASSLGGLADDYDSDDDDDDDGDNNYDVEDVEDVKHEHELEEKEHEDQEDKENAQVATQEKENYLRQLVQSLKKNLQERSEAGEDTSTDIEFEQKVRRALRDVAVHRVMARRALTAKSARE